MNDVASGAGAGGRERGWWRVVLATLLFLLVPATPRDLASCCRSTRRSCSSRRRWRPARWPAGGPAGGSRWRSCGSRSTAVLFAMFAASGAIVRLPRVRLGGAAGGDVRGPGDSVRTARRRSARSRRTRSRGVARGGRRGGARRRDGAVAGRRWSRWFARSAARKRTASVARASGGRRRDRRSGRPVRRQPRREDGRRRDGAQACVRGGGAARSRRCSRSNRWSALAHRVGRVSPASAGRGWDRRSRRCGISASATSSCGGWSRGSRWSSCRDSRR